MTLPDNTQSQAPPEQPADARRPAVSKRAVRRTRMGGIWVAATLFAVVLLLLLVFILENGHQVDIGYFGAHGHLPLGVALLLAAVLGILLVVIPGAGRIIQLRRTARRHHKAAKAAASQPAQPSEPAQPSQPSEPSQLPESSEPSQLSQPPAGDQQAGDPSPGQRPGA
jgi:uncharacterized integral membrane protein